jgi:predicted transcriptional regulator
MREAIEEYVEREEKREQFRQDALAAWDHYRTTGLHVTSEEADAWLAKLEAGKKAATPKCHDWVVVILPNSTTKGTKIHEGNP